MQFCLSIIYKRGKEMDKIKSIIIAVLVLISFNLSAQSPNELKQKAEEEIKAEDAYWNAVSNMYRCIIFDPINKGTYIPCFCYPLLAPVWVHTFISLDGNLRVNIFYDDNGKVGDIFYAAIVKSYGAAKFTEDTDTVAPSIEMKLENENLMFIQDEFDPYRFDIVIW